MSTPIYSPHNYKRNLILYWKQYYPEYKIPKGFHVHHIKPKCTFEDENDPRIHHPRNLIALHPDDHQSIHRLRGDMRAASGGFLNMRDYKHSEKTRAKMRQSAKNRPARSQESIARQSDAAKLRKFSETHRDNIVRANKNRAGWHHTTEIKSQISKSVTGVNNGMYGKHHSAETCNRISESKLLRSPADNLTAYSRTKTVNEINKQKATKSSPAWIAANTFDCPHCNKSIKGKSNFNRWHGENCKAILPIQFSFSELRRNCSSLAHRHNCSTS